MTRNNQPHLRQLVLIQIIIFSSLLLQGTDSYAESNSDAMAWIQKMSLAMQQLSYQGRFVYLHDGQLESMSIVHVQDELGRRERLVSLNGEAREILRDNKNLTCIWPSSKQVVIDKAKQSRTLSPIWIPEDVKRLSKFYKFETLGYDRIADHDVIIVSIIPADRFRYGMKVWLDVKTGLLLQSTVMDANENSVEQVMFTDLSLLGNEDQRAFSVVPEIDSSFAMIRSHEDVDTASVTSDNRWQLKSLPGGFWLESSFRKQMASSDEFTQQMIFTDGMASVSVFIERANGQQLSGESSMGAVNAFGSIYKDYTITAIGEVPAITVRQMAESVEYLN